MRQLFHSMRLAYHRVSIQTDSPQAWSELEAILRPFEHVGLGGAVNYSTIINAFDELLESGVFDVLVDIERHAHNPLAASCVEVSRGILRAIEEVIEASYTVVSPSDDCYRPLSPVGKCK